MEIANLTVAIIGVIVAIIIGFFSARAVNKRLRQKQNAKNHSIAVQSGRDTKIG